MQMFPNSTLVQPYVCNSATRPASPFAGMLIWETDNAVLRYWDGSNWRRTAPDRRYAAASGSITPGFNIDTACTGATVTFSTVSPNAHVMVQAVFDFEMSVTGAGVMVGSTFLDGSAAGAGTAIFTPGTTGRQSTPVNNDITIASAGSHTIALYAHKTVNGGTVQCYLNNTSLSLTIYD